MDPYSVWSAGSGSNRAKITHKSEDIASSEVLDAVLRIWIRDPGLGAFLTPGSKIRDEQPGSYFLELRNHFYALFGVKILKFFDEDPGSGIETVRIRDGKKSDPGSGINIPDPQHWLDVLF